MALNTLNMVVASVINNDDFVIFTFACDSVAGTIGQISYNGAFEDYQFVQNEAMTEAGIAVNEYGAITVPSDQMETTAVKDLEITSGGRTAKPSQELQTMLAGLEIGSSVAFTFA